MRKRNVDVYPVDYIVKKSYNCASRNLDEVGFFLANASDVSALKILKVLVYTTKFGILRKRIDVNKTFIVKGQSFSGIVYNHEENIASSLVNNPLYISREVLSDISRLTKVDFSFKPYGEDTFTLCEQLARIVYDVNDSSSRFYKREDLVGKNLDILKFFVKRGIISSSGEDYCFEDIKELVNRAKMMGALDSTIISLLKILKAEEKACFKSYEDVICASMKNKNACSSLNEELCHADLSYMGEVVVPYMKKIKK